MISVNCFLCGKKLAEMSTEGNTEIHIKCSKCKTINKINQSVENANSTNWSSTTTQAGKV